MLMLKQSRTTLKPETQGGVSSISRVQTIAGSTTHGSYEGAPWTVICHMHILSPISAGWELSLPDHRLGPGSGQGLRCQAPHRGGQVGGPHVTPPKHVLGTHVCRVCISDVQTELGQETLKELRAEFGEERVVFVQCDVSKAEDFNR